MGKFDGRTSRLFYDIKAIQKEQKQSRKNRNNLNGNKKIEAKMK